MKNINSFLESGLLEKYLLGDINAKETETVEGYINNHSEVKEAYNLLQDNLEILSKANALDAPQDILNNVLNALNDKSVITLQKTKKAFPWYAIAASVAAIMFAITTTYLYVQNQTLHNETLIVDEEINDLRNDIAETNSKLESVMKQFMRLNNPETEKYIIRGNKRAKNLKTVAYINPKEKTSMVEIVSLPQLPEEQCFQMWAQMNDKMVDLGILDPAIRDLKSIPYTENALSINVTIEPKGGSETATVENSVANIKLQTETVEH